VGSIVFSENPQGLVTRSVHLEGGIVLPLSFDPNAAKPVGFRRQARNLT